MNLFNFFKASNKQSREIAKDRLKLVLIHDRGDFSPEKKELIKQDLLVVLSKYMEVDEANIDISIVNKKDTADENAVPQLIANIPIKKIF
ncbi:cell division topological specificity factor MinE [Peptostreptococcaceae bacterium AS15]|nr:cell division topological specificity factor MinE [[Eubacterium] yurii subsp. margaretiae ATCC 43715]EJP22997.1 cell division topological specificity factor MinE [Peptostreptococcaceae bacterium AS15]